MSAINWNATQNWLSSKQQLVSSNVSGGDWVAFLDALGWAENSGRYGGAGGANGAYSGMYQTDDGQLNYQGFYSNVGSKFLSINNRHQFQANPLAQDIAAIMEFSGVPDDFAGHAFVSKYTAVKLQARDRFPALYAGWDQLVGKSIAISYVGAGGGVVGSQTVILSLAGIAGAAHLIGEGGVTSFL